MDNPHPVTDWARTAGGLTYIADDIEELVGYTAEEVLAQPGIIATPEARDELWAIHRKQFAQKKSSDRMDSCAVTLTIKHKDSHAVRAEFTLITLYDHGWPVEMIGTIRQCHCHRCPLIKEIVTDLLALDDGDRQLMADLVQRLAA